MVDDWDDDGSFEARANLDVGEVDLQARDPFDLSRALEGASMEHPARTSAALCCIQNTRLPGINRKPSSNLSSKSRAVKNGACCLV